MRGTLLARAELTDGREADRSRERTKRRVQVTRSAGYARVERQEGFVKCRTSEGTMWKVQQVSEVPNSEVSAPVAQRRDLHVREEWDRCGVRVQLH